MRARQLFEFRTLPALTGAASLVLLWVMLFLSVSLVPVRAAFSSNAATLKTTHVRQASGALEQTQLPGGRNTTFAYDGDHRLISSIKPGADSGNRTNGYAYDTDASGYPRTIFTDGDGLARISTFDRLGRLRFLQDKRLHTFEFRYDALGRKTQVIAPGRPAVVTNHTHDGRVVSETEPSGDSAAFTYHPRTGRLQGITYQQAGEGERGQA
jgi:YD repeat-containing protein